jgi:hypothetical protein
MAQGEQVLKPDLRHGGSQGLRPFDRGDPIFAGAGSLGNQASNGPSVAGDDDGFTLLDLIEKLGQVDFCFGGLNLARHTDWSL